MNYEFASNSVNETIAFGQKLGRQLKGGEVICLVGQLGSGKTQLVKGIAAGAGAEDKSVINSPTFVIVNEYKGALDIYHIDAYRLSSIREFEMIGFDDFCYFDSVVLIEWADKIEPALKGIDYINIKFTDKGQTSRLIQIENLPEYFIF